MDRLDKDMAPETQNQGAVQDVDQIKSANSQKMVGKRVENEAKDKAEAGLKVVIDTATLECMLCTNPKGIMVVNYDTPTIQEKKTATVKEKGPTSLVFMGTCKKSPQMAIPCAAVMNVREWKDVGTYQSQEELILLQKSTIPCTYGQVDIKITDSGQIHQPESIDVAGAPVPEKNEKVNGYFFNYDGTFEGQVVGEKAGEKTDVYACEGKGSEKDIYLRIKKISIKYEKFISDSSTTYGESSAAYDVIDRLEFFAIASVHKRNKKAYGINSDFAKKFRALKDIDRNNHESMKHSIAAEINVLTDGHDYSNGAKQWDGAEQTHLPKDEDSSSNGKFMFKVNVMGWDITDKHYTSWETAIGDKFGDKFFNIPQKKYAVSDYGGMKNKDKIRLQSAAQYALTMFWNEVDIKNPKGK